MKIFARMIVLSALLAALAAPAAAQTVAEIEARYPDCAGMFSQENVDALRRASTDPREAFEKWRRSHLTMVEESPRTVCQSRIWRGLRGGTREASLQKLVAMFSGVSPFVPLFEAMAVVGKNVVPADGLEKYQGETFIAVNPNDPLQLVAGANSFFQDNDSACDAPPPGQLKTFGTQALFGSTDGGKTWEHRCAPWHPGVIGGVAGADEWFGSDPSLAWDAAGNAYAAYLLISQEGDTKPFKLGSAIMVAKSGDAGNSWSPLGVVANDITKSFPFHDKPMLAIDTSIESPHLGRMYVIWDRIEETKAILRISYSDDGVTWTPGTIVGAPHDPKGGNLAIGADGTVYAVWNRVHYPTVGLDGVYTGKVDPDEIWFSKSTDGGETWSQPKRIFNLKRGSFQGYYLPAAQDMRNITSFLSIGIDRNPASAFFGRLYLTYADSTWTQDNDFGQIDVYSVHSVDGGLSWTAPLRVNDDEDGLTHFFPWLAVDQSDGAVHIAWYDTRIDPDDDRRVQVYYTRSIDGGVSFERNFNLIDGGSNFPNEVDFLNENSEDRKELELEYNPNQYGDYMGIAAADRKAFAFWTDTRQFMPDPGLDALVFKREDVAAATVTHCSPPEWDGGPTATLTPSGSGIEVSWQPPSSWGTNATSGAYPAVLRYDTIACSGNGVELPGIPGVGPIVDAPPTGFNFGYRVRARNNCPGTPLTPMESLSPCSNLVDFGNP
jgi:hypothetical protein